MKKTLAVLLLVAGVLSATCEARAQEYSSGTSDDFPRWEIRGGVGWFSPLDFICSLGTAFGTIDLGANNDNGITTRREGWCASLNPSVEVFYNFTPRISVGVSATVGHISSRLVYVTGGSGVRKSKAFTYPSLMVSARTIYWRTEDNLWRIYGTSGVGISLVCVKDVDTDGGVSTSLEKTVMANFYPLGVSFGTSRGLFAEVGWGAQGFINMGGFFSF